MNFRALFLIIATLSLLSCKQEKSTAASERNVPEAKWMLGFHKTEINPQEMESPNLEELQIDFGNYELPQIASDSVTY